MSFFPAGFDRAARGVRLFRLADMNTPDGDFGFILGSDGRFVDVNGKEWWGSRLISTESLGFGLGGTAKASSVTLSYFEDPAEPSDLTTQVRAAGAAYVKGRSLKFYLQTFASTEERYAPSMPPRLYATMIMDHLTLAAPSDLVRSITIHLESAFRVRGGASNLVYNTTDHARQIGAPDPSYEFIPVDPRQERSLLS